jgi:hypothetical protein
VQTARLIELWEIILNWVVYQVTLKSKEIIMLGILLVVLLVILILRVA